MEDPILQFFSYSHLPAPLASVSEVFYQAAMKVVQMTPRNPERTVALRKLLEAKDCAVRAYIYKADAETVVLDAAPVAGGRIYGY